MRMSDYKLTVSLSPEEKKTLETLAESLDLNKSATMRHALMQSAVRSTLPDRGQFLPLNGIAIPIRLVSDSEAHDE